jgi:hypothetical protein
MLVMLNVLKTKLAVLNKQIAAVHDDPNVAMNKIIKQSWRNTGLSTLATVMCVNGKNHHHVDCDEKLQLYCKT